jgi:cytochrome c nitrite reductase small subunit
MESGMRLSKPGFPALLSALTGSMIGLGLYTFLYAQGYSYFSNDPNACANCHLMRDYLDSWQKSSHHARATCNDCHTPHALLPKLVTKAENGWNHSMKFTLQNFHEPIRLRVSNAGRLQANCLRCHQDMIDEIGPDADCVRCHAGVGHGPRR